MIHRVFIASSSRPLRNIREMDCEIKVCGKTTWAIDKTGARHLLGSTAFYTRKAAERVKLAALQKIAENQVLARMWRTQDMWHSAVRQLKEYRATGTMH